MALAAGKRNQRITYQRLVDGRNTLGQPTKVWENLPTRSGDWAFYKPVRGAEFFGAGQMQARADAVFNVRYRSDVNERMRIVMGTQVFEITAPPVDINGAMTDMELFCSAGVADGR